MSITDKVRKDLWAKSGNRCAICKKEFFTSIDTNDFNIGEECHIVSSKLNGPRHIEYYGDYDAYDNIILLCRNHHKEIDDPANLSKYTIAKLVEIKKEHEKWVRQSLNPERIAAFSIISNGTDLVSIIGGSNAIYKYNDEIQSESEAELIGGFWQEITDFMDIFLDLEPIQITRTEFSYSKLINELNESGFMVYGRKIKIPLLKKYGDSTLYSAAQIYIKRK